MFNQISQLGFTQYNDSHQEEYTYTLGSSNYMPISLLLSLMSHYKQSPHRLFNLFCSTYSIKESKLNFDNILTKENQETITEQFNKDYVHESLQKSMSEMSLKADYKEMELFHYVDVWSDFLNMATPKYNTDTEYTVMCCPPDYIRFHNREEFHKPMIAVHEALIHILQEVSIIMGKRGFILNHNKFSFEFPGFNPIQVKEYYGF